MTGKPSWTPGVQNVKTAQAGDSLVVEVVILTAWGSEAIGTVTVTRDKITGVIASGGDKWMRKSTPPGPHTDLIDPALRAAVAITEALLIPDMRCWTKVMESKPRQVATTAGEDSGG